MTVLDEQALIEKYIALHPIKPGRLNAILKDNGFPIAGLILDLRPEELVGPPTSELMSDLSAAFGLSDEAIHAALAYYRRHRELFEARRLVELDAAATSL